MERHRLYIVLISIHRLDSHDLKNGNAHATAMKKRFAFEYEFSFTDTKYNRDHRPTINLVCIHCKNSGVKLTPAGVNTGSISNGVNLTPFWCYFNTFWC